jgi:hypothetical protein
MRGLMVRSPWIEKILAGEKTWEIRGSNTRVRESVALIRAGSGRIVGGADIIDSVGPLTRAQLADTTGKHCIPDDRIDEVIGRYKRIYAWVLTGAKALPEAIPYDHPSGAVIWVTLPDDCMSN